MGILKTIETTFWELFYKCQKQQSRFTREEALKIAHDYNLETEVIQAMSHGCTPDEALQEWDLYIINK